jgi:inner membrane transporter RhtA
MPPVALAVVAMVLLHSGAAFATHLFGEVGPSGVTWLRLTLAALILLAATGRTLVPAVRAASARDLLATVGLGVVSAGMMLFYAQATARIPLGTATALEFLGPLTVAVVGMRGRRELMWIGAAIAGVLLMTRPWSGDASLTGILFALAAACCWGGYIVGAQHVGSKFKVQHGLALTLAVGSLVTAPFGAPAIVADPRPGLLLAGLGVALLMPLVPFLLEMSVLQRMSRSAYGTVAGMEPAVSLLAGLVIAAQVPGLVQVAGIALVVVAGIGAARGDRARASAPVPEPVAEPVPEPVGASAGLGVQQVEELGGHAKAA